MIESCSFGTLVVDGKTYTSDLIIYPDGRVEDQWWRKNGHRLSAGDIGKLIRAEPEVIVAGTGVSGRMRPAPNLEKKLSEKGIRFLTAPNSEAMKTYNELLFVKKVGACFHLTC